MRVGVMGAVVLGLGVAFALGRRGGDGEAPSKGTQGGGGPLKPSAAAQRIREIAARVQAVTGGWPGLGTFLVVTAYTESRLNPNAGTNAWSNDARGWFGLRPKSAADSVALPSPSEVNYFTKNEAQSVARAAWYAYRLRAYASQGQVVDWLAVRRGFAFPRLVSDDAEVAEVGGYEPGERSRDVRVRMEKGAAAMGVPESFLYEPAFMPGFTWPGPDVVIAAAMGGVA